MIRAAVFDLDGTIADTLENLAFCSNSVLSEFGLPAVDTVHYKHFVGDGASTQIRRVLRYLKKDEDELHEKVFRRYLDFFDRNCLQKVVSYDGIPELLASLKKLGISCTVFSNKPHLQAVKVVEGIFPKGTFEIIRGQQEGFPKKPAPDGALLIAKELGVSPSECIYLGDTDTDMKTGKNAGMFTVGVLWGFREEDELKKAGADALAAAPADVLSFISRLS